MLALGKTMLKIYYNHSMIPKSLPDYKRFFYGTIKICLRPLPVIFPFHVWVRHFFKAEKTTLELKQKCLLDPFQLYCFMCGSEVRKILDQYTAETCGHTNILHMINSDKLYKLHIQTKML